MSKKLDKESLIELYKKEVNNFSEEELNDVVEFFSSVYSKNYIKTQEEAINILIEEGLSKALLKLSQEKKIEFKKKFLSL